jgi:DNA-3-methyladenine glycosylase
VAGASASRWRSVLSGRASQVAPCLLGAEITVGERRGRIVEVEAYEGLDDPASHAYRGPTPRTTIMFGRPGHLYVYLSYGVHWCANVVCHGEGSAGAVLLRAIEPLAGVESMWLDRPAARSETDLGSGPGKLCAALAITDQHNGVDLLHQASPVVWTGAAAAPDEAELVRGPRIGISRAVDRSWRFGLAGSAHLSRPFPDPTVT